MSDLMHAVDTIEQLRAEVTRLNQTIVDRDTTIMRQGEDNARLRAALALFAEPFNWFWTGTARAAWAYDLSGPREPWAIARDALGRDAPATPPPPAATPL